MTEPQWEHHWQIDTAGLWELNSGLRPDSPPGLYSDRTEVDTATLLARMGEAILTGTATDRWLDDVRTVATISGRINVTRGGTGATTSYETPDSYWQWAALSAHVAANLACLDAVLMAGPQCAAEDAAEGQRKFEQRYSPDHPIWTSLPTPFGGNPWTLLAWRRFHGEPIETTAQYRRIAEVRAINSLEFALRDAPLVSAVDHHYVSTATTHALMWLAIWWGEASIIKTCGDIEDMQAHARGCGKRFVPLRADQRYCLTDKISSRCRQKRRQAP